ncbi:MAG: MlaD family protein [Actinomycetota bacterium]|nr:MlaD family protein [Actinomycetota bacterium]
MRGSRASSIAGNPVLIGAVTVLVTVVAVFLAYNANSGLPFVPVFEMKVETPDAGRLVVGNEVREGGFRIGQVSEIQTIRDEAGEPVGAQLTLALDEFVTPIPADTDFFIRPRSVLGLKYVDMVRGQSGEALRAGSTVEVNEQAIPPDFSDVFDMFDEPTRENIRINLATFGGGLAGRGMALNRTFQSLPELLADIQPVMRTLSDEQDTQLERFLNELADAARVTRPVSDQLAEGFTFMADTFEGISRDPAALQATISGSPPTLRAGLRSLPVQRPFLRRVAALSDEVRGSAAQLRTSLPAINSALAAGIPVLGRVPELNENLELGLDALLDLTSSPSTNLVLQGLGATADTLDVTLKYLGPHFTVCNYFNYMWTFTADHFSAYAGPEIGFFERIQGKSAPEQKNSLAAYGAEEPANAEPFDDVVPPEATSFLGDPAKLNAPFLGRAVDAEGRADCENAGRPYGTRNARGVPPEYDIQLDPRTPGNQGTTFTGRERVPEGQTFTAEPGGLAPAVNDIPADEPGGTR